MLKTRHNLTIPLLALLAWLGLCAPAIAKTLIGVIMPGDTPYFTEVHKALQESLKTEMPPGSDFEIILQHPFPDPVALGNATRKLVAAGADILITYGATATLAVINEKVKLPLIYSGVYDPENAPFAGLNLTGCGYKIPMTSLLRYLKELKHIAAVSVLYCSLENDTVRQVNELSELAKEQQITLIPINIKNREKLDKAQLSKGDAILITGGSIVNLQLEEILAIAQAHQQPSIGIFPDSKEAGVTISLYNNPQSQGKKTAQIAAQIIAGQHPRDIKPEIMRNTELVFNLRGAKEIGVKIPFQMVAEASKVIK
ncbi:MAG: hypothetical protein HGA96_07955 [Desulfobulbaceae bacterium]|nr:hypothetical protein [Desulfobulbaceae bacterium]